MRSSPKAWGWTACLRRCASATNRCRGPEPDLLVVDTSGLVALVDEDDPQHDAVSRIIDAEPGPLYLPPFVLQEVDYLVTQRLGAARVYALLEDVADDAYRLEPFEARDIAATLAIMRRYSDMAIGLADASIVVIAARHGTDRILTLDERHFRAVRPLRGEAFTILPADA